MEVDQGFRLLIEFVSVLASLERHANVYQRHIVPILSASIDFYVRVFVRVFDSPAETLKSMTKLSLVYQVRPFSNALLHEALYSNAEGTTVYRLRYIPSTATRREEREQLHSAGMSLSNKLLRRV